MLMPCGWPRRLRLYIDDVAAAYCYATRWITLRYDDIVSSYADALTLPRYLLSLPERYAAAEDDIFAAIFAEPAAFAIISPADANIAAAALRCRASHTPRLDTLHCQLFIDSHAAATMLYYLLLMPYC